MTKMLPTTRNNSITRVTDDVTVCRVAAAEAMALEEEERGQQEEEEEEEGGREITSCDRHERGRVGAGRRETSVMRKGRYTSIMQ